jgi:hypothetical protein
MRKLLIAVLALASLGVVASVAWAANVYEVHKADSSVGKGSVGGPLATFFEFGFKSRNAVSNRRPDVSKGFKIAAEGAVAYPDARPKCTFEQANDPNVTRPADLPRACRRAIVGSGTIDNEIGATNSPEERAQCDVQVTLLNLSNGDTRFPKTVKQIRKRGGLGVRIDTDPPDCIASVHESLAAPFYDTKIQGIPTTELRFSVPDPLLHPGGVLSLAITEVDTTISKKTGRVVVENGKPQPAAKRRVGFYSLVGRKGRTRTLRVTFMDESGAKTTETKQFR